MSTATLAPPPEPVISYDPQPYRWTCDEFHDLGDRGFFDGRRAVLIDGEILVMPMANPAHVTSLHLVAKYLDRTFPNHYLRNQSPLNVGTRNDPGPDLAVVEGSIRDYAKRQATTAILVVEISDSSLAFDLGPKSNLYAAASVSEYWVLDLDDRKLVVHRDPMADPDAPREFRYSSVRSFAETDRVSPLAAPQASALVAEFLP